MAETKLSDIIDYPKIRKIIGDKWINDSALMQTNAVARNPLSNEGTYEYTLRQRVFQDSSGYAVAEGDPIPATKKEQLNVKHPKIWRYGRNDDPLVLEQIEVKAEQENADMASGIREASAQYLDDSLINTIVGVGAANTGNQYGTAAATIALTDITSTMAKLGERGLMLKGGAMLGNSAIYWKLVDLGLVAATSNTFGNANQDRMVNMGMLPENLLGMTFIMSDKLTAVSGTKYYLYLCGPGSVAQYGDDAPFIMSGDKVGQGIMDFVTLFQVKFGVGVVGFTYGGTMSNVIEDSDLATSANWTLAAANAKLVKLARAYVETA